MKQDAHRRKGTIASRLAAVGGTALKAAAWIVAVPALCLVVGAVPLYLLLPDTKPKPATPAQPMVASAARPVAADAAPSTPKAEPETKVASADPAAVGAIAPPAEEPPASEEAVAAPQEDKAAAAARPDVVSVIPTPRPAPPAEAAGAPADPAPTPASKPDTRLAAVEPSEPPAPTRPDAKAAAGGNAVVLRTVTLRASPWGRELGTLDRGTSVLVGACDEWCEVRVGGGSRGFVHSSFLGGAGSPRRDAEAQSRSPDRRVAQEQAARRQERNAREARALARAAERRRYYEEREPVEPDWFIDDERPVVIERRRPPPARFYAPDDYIPY